MTLHLVSKNVDFPFWVKKLVFDAALLSSVRPGRGQAYNLYWTCSFVTVTDIIPLFSMLVRYIIAKPLLFFSPSYVPSFYFDTSIFFLNKLKFSLRKTVLKVEIRYS